MDRAILEKYISENLSTREIVEQTGKSQTTVRYWLKKYGLSTNILPFNRDGKAHKTQAWRKKQCKCSVCGETDPSRFYQRKGRHAKFPRCKTCHNRSQIERFRSYKKMAVEYKGGKCVRCGYDKCLASLDFHHVDPSQKDPNWRRMRNWVFERIKEELDKCDLVCRNCHGEIHNGQRA